HPQAKCDVRTRAGRRNFARRAQACSCRNTDLVQNRISIIRVNVVGKRDRGTSASLVSYGRHFCALFRKLGGKLWRIWPKYGRKMAPSGAFFEAPKRHFGVLELPASG